MTDWFDPETWLRQIPDPLNVRGMLQDGAQTWLNEFARVAHDRPVEARRGDNVVLGTIRRVKLQPTPATRALVPRSGGFDALERAYLVLDDVEVNGRAVDRVEVRVEDVRVSQPPRGRIRGGPVTLQLEVPMATLTTWLADAGIEVIDDPACPDRHFAVRYRWWRFTFDARVEPRVTRDTAVFEIHGLRARGREVPLPKAFRLSLSVPLSLGPGVRLRDAELLERDTLAVEVRVDSIDYPYSPQQILDQLAMATPRSLFDITST